MTVVTNDHHKFSVYLPTHLRHSTTNHEKDKTVWFLTTFPVGKYIGSVILQTIPAPHGSRLPHILATQLTSTSRVAKSLVHARGPVVHQGTPGTDWSTKDTCWTTMGQWLTCFPYTPLDSGQEQSRLFNVALGIRLYGCQLREY